jgi:hypothetical protein
VTAPECRAIGMYGTAARVAVGALLVGSVLYGHADRGWHPAAWWWARGHPAPLRASNPVGHGVNLAVFLALYLTWWHAPAVDAVSDAALLFYGGSMLLAAVLGYAGCEVLAVSNWLLRRDDQVGCAAFGPIDAVETRHKVRQIPGTTSGGRP